MNQSTNNNNALVNPTINDFDQDYTDEEIPELAAEGQLSMPTGGIIATSKQLTGALRYRLKRRRDVTELSQLWQSIAIPFAIVSWLGVIVTLVIGGLIVFNDLPPSIPLIYDSANNRWEQVDKSIVFILALFIGLAEFLALRFITQIFRSDRRLALTFAFIIAFLNTMLLLAIAQIYSLIS